MVTGGNSLLLGFVERLNHDLAHKCPPVRECLYFWAVSCSLNDHELCTEPMNFHASRSGVNVSGWACSFASRRFSFQVFLYPLSSSIHRFFQTIKLRVSAAPTPVERKFGAWIGGSILASLVGNYVFLLCGCNFLMCVVNCVLWSLAL